MITEEPRTFLLRRKEVLSWTGISVSLLDKLVRNEVLHPVKIGIKGRRYFRKDEIKQLLECYGKPPG